MRWLKHLTVARDDERIAALIDRMGWRGYGLWWAILEIIAGRMEKGSTKCSLHYPVSKWAALLQLHPPNVYRTLAGIGADGLLTLRCTPADGLLTPRCTPADGLLTPRCTPADIEITVPNLLKYRDEYSSRGEPKSGHCQEQDTETDTDTDTDTEKNKDDGVILTPPGSEAANEHRASRRKGNQETTSEIVERMCLEHRLQFRELWEIHGVGSKRTAALNFAALKPSEELWVGIRHGAKCYAAEVRNRQKQSPDFHGQHTERFITAARWEEYEGKPADDTESSQYRSAAEVLAEQDRRERQP